MENTTAAAVTRKHLQNAMFALKTAKTHLRTSPDWILDAELTAAIHAIEDEHRRLYMLIEECEVYASR